MESDVTHSESLWKAYAWVEAHKKQVLFGVVGAVAVAATVYGLIWQREQKELTAASTLSNLQSTQTVGGLPKPGAGAAYLKVNADFPSTKAGQHALLLGAAALFTEAKYAEALAQFQKYARDFSSSPMLPQARLGIATCQESLGKTNEAVGAYNDVIQRHAKSAAAPRAKFNLARLYVAQNKAEQARTLLEELMQEERFSMLGSEAMALLMELNASHPEWAAAAAAAAATNLPPAVSPVSVPTNAPAPSDGRAVSGQSGSDPKAPAPKN